MIFRLTCCALILISCATAAVTAGQTETGGLSFHRAKDRITLLHGKHAISEYVFSDPAVPRPYLTGVRTADGIQVTRNHPVQPGDDQDHPHHTGIFFTFGDLNGIDFWHLKGRVVHSRFVTQPSADGGIVRFATENRYETLDGSTVLAGEQVTVTASMTDDGILYRFEHALQPRDDELRIGSKEEGGLAVRVATPLAITSQAGGRMIDADGRSGGGNIWGRQTDWVDYSGRVRGRHVGVLVVPDRRNFSRCWWHARDYGLLAANPFGPLNAPDRIHRVRRGDTLTLRYHVLIHSSDPSDTSHVREAASRLLTTGDPKSP